jgi:hypothetical protein
VSDRVHDALQRALEADLTPAQLWLLVLRTCRLLGVHAR